MAEPTITERLRRLHRLYLVEAGANAVADTGGPLAVVRVLAGATSRHIKEELAAIEATAAEHGCTVNQRDRIRTALFDELRAAARLQAQLRIAHDVFRDGGAAAVCSESAIAQEQQAIRQQRNWAARRAQRAIRTVRGLLRAADGPEPRCPECGGLGGGHSRVHVRHETGGGGVNRACSRDTRAA